MSENGINIGTLICNKMYLKRKKNKFNCFKVSAWVLFFLFTSLLYQLSLDCVFFLIPYLITLFII